MSLVLKRYQRRTLDQLSAYLQDARVHGPAAAFTRHAPPGTPLYRSIVDAAGAPVHSLSAVPYVCLRLPTGGGKTVLGAHLIKRAANTYLDREFPLVLWLVPSRLVKSQTLDAFRNPKHPYRRELDDTFGGRVTVLDVTQIDQLRPADLVDRVCLVVATAATARVNNTELRDFYSHKESLEPHFIGGVALPPDLEKTDAGQVKFSFANILRMTHPLVITDEAHNFDTGLSYEVYERLQPAAILELTATPDAATSNVLVRVSASELKAEEMIKLPVVLQEHAGAWEEALSAALARRASLESLAAGENEYLRPILLVEAESSNAEATVEAVQAYLTGREGVDAEAIRVATGEQRELDGVDLFDPSCPVRVVITMEALREGWDCSFAYVLCSLSGLRSTTAIEQLLGRILRMPYAKRRKDAALNCAYAHVRSKYFGAGAQEFTDRLAHMGFNPYEAAASLQVTTPLPLVGGQAVPPAAPVATRIDLPRAPDLSGAPAGDLAKVVVTPTPGGRFVVDVTGAVDAATVDAIVAAGGNSKAKAQVRSTLVNHQARAVFAATPAQRMVPFEVPQLALELDGQWERADPDDILSLAGWRLADYPADLNGVSLQSDARTWLLDLNGERVEYQPVAATGAGGLPLLDFGWGSVELISWLDHVLRQPDVLQAELVEWLRIAISDLSARGFLLVQLVPGRFVLQRLLAEQIKSARQSAARAQVQRVLFDAPVPLAVGQGFNYRFDPLAYPMRYACPANYRWQKHYYAVPGDLPHKQASGALAEEFLCAQAIDLLDEVEFWVRNLAHPSQFWLPTAAGRTYPDFVAKLRDGRLLVVEYKGAHLLSGDDAKGKKLVGELWARASAGKAVYVMASLPDPQGLDLRTQLLRAINGG